MTTPRIYWLQAQGAAAASQPRVYWMQVTQPAVVVAPDAPAAVTGTATGATTATIVVTDTGGGAAVHRVQVRTGAGAWADAVGAENPMPPGVLSFAAAGLSSGLSHEARVRAERTGLNSTYVVSPAWWQDLAVSGGGELPTDTGAPTLTGSITVDSLTTTSYTVTCPAGTDAVGVVLYQWRFGGSGAWATIAAGARAVNITGRTPASTDTVEMRCGDAAGNFSNALSIGVTLLGLAPAVTTQPTAQSAVDGQPFTFTAAFSGAPTPTLQWFRNGSPISGATGPSYTGTASLAGTGAIFTCTATSTAGTATTNAAVLTVTAASVAPSIGTQPASQTVAAGQPVTFGVTAAGTSPVSFQWLRNGVPVGGATSPSYTFTPTGADSGALYSVVVSNIAGQVVSASATLTVASASIGAGDATITIGRGEWDLFSYRMRKQPREVRDVVIEMASWFAGRADGPASVSLEVSDPALSASATLTGTRIYVTAGAGADGGEYRITLLMTTTSVPAIVREFDLFVQVVEIQ